MKIVLLASNPQLFSNRRIMEAAKARGHSIRFINIEHCYMNISSHKPEIHYQKGKILKQVDAVIPRIKPSLTFYGNAVLRQFEVMGAYCVNSPISIRRSRDKLESLQILSKNRIEIPTTGFAHSPQNTKDLIQMVGGAPLIIKLLEGTQGLGVVLAETQKASESVIRAFKLLSANILVQEFIKESAGVDLRAFVIGNKVVAAVERRSMDGDFRANVHLGGQAFVTKITPKERALSVKAAKAMGLQVAGVDILRSSDGPKVIEINSSPGIEGIETATKKDIATMIIEHIEKNVKVNKKKES